MAAARGSGEDGASDRKHVDALLDISEEELLKELQPQRHRSYEGWDEAVSKSDVLGVLARPDSFGDGTNTVSFFHPTGARMDPIRASQLLVSDPEGREEAETEPSDSQRGGLCYQQRTGPVKPAPGPRRSPAGRGPALAFREPGNHRGPEGGSCRDQAPQAPQTHQHSGSH